MEYKKRVVMLDVHHNGNVTTVRVQTFENGIQTADIRIPFHAIDYIEEKTEIEFIVRPDAHCPDPCGDNPPTLIIPSEPLSVIVNEEFDPMEGVSAYDDHGKDITDTVTVTAEKQ